MLDGNTSPQLPPAENETLCSHTMFPIVGGVDHAVYHSEFAAMSRLLVGRGVTVVVPTPEVVLARVNFTDALDGNVGDAPAGADTRIASASADTVAPAVANRIAVWLVDVTATRPDATEYPRPWAMAGLLHVGGAWQKAPDPEVGAWALG